MQTNVSARRILQVVFSDSGRLNPQIAIAQSLERAGAAVAIFSCQADIREKLTLAGLRAESRSAAAPLPPSAAADGVTPSIPASLAYTRKARKRTWLKNWLSTVLLGGLPRQVDLLSAFVDDFRPDVLCIDPMAYAGAIVAERRGIPWIGAASSLTPVAPVGWTSPFTQTFQQIEGAREDVTNRLGAALKFTASDAISPTANVLFTVDEFAPREGHQNPSHVRVGPAAPHGSRGDEREFPWGRITGDRPVIYVSFGSVVSPEPAVFECIARAVQRDEAQLVVVAKDLASVPRAISLPPDAIVVEYAPQLRILEQASVMVTHGGFNSVSECLRFGVPMLVLPLINDQSLSASFVEHARVGHVLDVDGLSVEAVRTALLTMADPAAIERRGARQLADAYAKLNGGEAAAELALGLAGSPFRFPTETESRGSTQ